MIGLLVILLGFGLYYFQEIPEQGGYGKPFEGFVITESYEVERIFWHGGTAYTFLAQEWKEKEKMYYWRKWRDWHHNTVKITVDSAREKPNTIRRTINNPNTGYDIEIDIRSGKDIEFVPLP